LLKIGKFTGRKESIMKIALGNDYVAIEMKKQIKEYLIKKGYEVANFGTHTSARWDYPIYGEITANAVANGEVDLGILIPPYTVLPFSLLSSPGPYWSQFIIFISLLQL